MGPRIREDNGGEGEDGSRCDVMAGGTGGSRINPFQMVVRGNGGWVPASARTIREDKGEGG